MITESDGSLEFALALEDECRDSRCAISALQLRSQANASQVAFVGHLQWSNHPSKCLDVTDGRAENGNRLQLWDCKSTSENQIFAWRSTDGKLRWAAHPEFCVDVKDHGDRPGTWLQLWECLSGNSDQSFSFRTSGHGHIRWTNHPDKCLDVKDHGTHNGNKFQIWYCSDLNTDQVFGFSQEPSTASTTPSGTWQPSDRSSDADVIVVGGGLAGSALAARLAESPSLRVMLLEAGKASQRSLGGKDPPATWKGSHWEPWKGVTGLTRYDVPGNYEVMQCWNRNCPESWGHDVPFFQCKALGGCGVMNGALVQRPHDSSFVHWPPGWQSSDLAPYFEDAQSLFHITATPSSDGKHYLDQAGADFVRHAFEKAGFVMDQGLRRTSKTMCTPEVTAKNGIRQSTTSQLLPKALQRHNFELRLETEVIEILHDGNAATGVHVRSRGRSETIGLKPGGMIVVSAGALNTPRLLLQSGLTAYGQVGKQLSDHALVSMVYKTPRWADNGATEAFSLDHLQQNYIFQYVEMYSGPLAQFGPTLTAFVRDPSTPGPQGVYDVEIWVNPRGKAGEVHVSLALMRPTCSKATLRLEGGKLRYDGSLYLGCSRDRSTMDWATRQVDGWLGLQGAKRVYTGSAMALNHFAGTCALGTCVDPSNLRLHGTSNVAVVDASILPEQVWGHPYLTLTAIALKAADVLAVSMLM